MQGSLSIERMCQLVGVSRAGFYRSLEEQKPVERKWRLGRRFSRSRWNTGGAMAIGELRLNCGRRGMLVNHKRVARIMREDNLLATQPRAFVVTTDSDHEFEVYLNLAESHETDGDESALGSKAAADADTLVTNTGAPNTRRCPA